MDSQRPLASKVVSKVIAYCVPSGCVNKAFLYTCHLMNKNFRPRRWILSRKLIMRSSRHGIINGIYAILEYNAPLLKWIPNLLFCHELNWILFLWCQNCYFFESIQYFHHLFLIDSCGIRRKSEHLECPFEYEFKAYCVQFIIWNKKKKLFCLNIYIN